MLLSFYIPVIVILIVLFGYMFYVYWLLQKYMPLALGYTNELFAAGANTTLVLQTVEAIENTFEGHVEQIEGVSVLLSAAANVTTYMVFCFQAQYCP